MNCSRMEALRCPQLSLKNKYIAISTLTSIALISLAASFASYYLKIPMRSRLVMCNSSAITACISGLAVSILLCSCKGAEEERSDDLARLKSYANFQGDINHTIVEPHNRGVMVRFSNEGVELMGRGNIGDLEVEPHTPACALCNIEAVGYNERGYTLIRSPAGYPLIIPTSDNPPVTFLAMSLNQRAEIVRLADRFITELKEQTEGEDYRLVFPCGRPAGQRQWHAYGRIAAENLGDWQNNHYDTFPPR